jgi:hypothetical protein
MTELEWVRRAIRRCEEKLAAAGDELSRYYYRCCIVGHEAHLRKLLAGEW